jgi:hypothetical protein
MQEPSSEHEATQSVAGPGSAVNDDDDDGDDDDGDMVAGPTVEAHVNLAKTSSK